MASGFAFADNGAVLIHELERRVGKPFRKLPRIGDSRRRADELRPASVKGADPRQTPKHVGYMTAKDAAIGVQLIHNDELEILEQARPFGVMRQNPFVQHVGIAENDVAFGPNRRARILRGIAIVGKHAHLPVEHVCPLH